ncbi:hypothetical protein ABZ725_41865 [Streptomyces sp. NPDC006872]|uniref:hypothetical protein n=1 Tax=Streptomyces sp. NPDC006872 TaxID=3155720 RepID=UPI0033CFB5A4
MTKLDTPTVVELVAAATAVHTLFEAYQAAGFTRTEALALVRDSVRPVGVAQ